MIAALVQAISLGFTAGILPGPLQAFLFVQTLRHRATYARWLIFSPFLSDVPAIIIVLAILGQASDGLLRALSFVGGSFILFIAWGIWRQIRSGGFQLSVTEEATVEKPSVWSGIRQTAAINFFGPGPWLFWGTVTGPILIDLWRETPINGIGFMVGFYVTFIGVLLTEVMVFDQARRMGTQMVNVMLKVGLVVLIIFAGVLWWRAYSGF
ncbi:MAG: hypothetical protein H6673_08880 [Anaerolineales bacterium]|nr:hypothetical protein [Anaerolineales bacterium]